MMQKATFTTMFRRRKEGKTNYAKRLAMVKSNQLRVVVRKTNKQVYAQAIAFMVPGDRVLAQAHAKELVKFGWNKALCNTPAAYLTGFLLGLRMKKAGNTTGIFDIGFNSQMHGGVCFAVLKGVITAGITVPFEEAALPKENRILGEHLGKETNELVQKVKAALETGA